MADLVADCPRCGSQKITFDLTQEHNIYARHGWQQWFEAFCVCRHCGRSTTFVLSQKNPGTLDNYQNSPRKVPGAVNAYMSIEGHISLKDESAIDPPEHLPEDIAAAFSEGTKCHAIGCYNAAGTMFRLCVDLATRKLMPQEDQDGLNSKIRRSLGLRLAWLFDTQRLPEALRELSTAVKDDGNDGAHEGTLSQHDADDLLDFTIALLERLYTEPERLRLAKERRDARRNGGVTTAS